MQEIAKLLLADVLLGEVLEVSLGERQFGIDDDFVLVTRDGDLGTKFSSFAVDLDLVVEKFLEASSIHDFVATGGGTVDGVLRNVLLAGFLSGGLLKS